MMMKSWVIGFSLGFIALSGCASADDAGNDDTDDSVTTFSLGLEAGAHGSVTANPELTSYEASALVTLTAIPDVGYKVDGWSGTDDDASGSPVNHVTMDADTTIIVTFTAVTAATHTLTLQPEGYGTIQATPAGPTYQDGTTVILTAVPDVGFELSTWGGTDNDLTASRTNTVTMTADTTVTATFDSASYTLTLRSLPARGGPDDTWGYITADPPDLDYCDTDVEETIEYPANTVVTLTATQDVSTWGFTNWNMPDDSHPTTCTVQVTMDADKTVEAEFPLGAGVGGIGCP
jgi:hypothetical protein